MAIHRTRKNKESPHYNFLVSWKPDKSTVNRESASEKHSSGSKLTATKRADILAKADSAAQTRKDIVKSLILVSLILAIEIVVYLARNNF